GMARGWTEFWLVWIAVDIVGVPLLLKAGYYPSAFLYMVYGGVVLYGFSVWVRAQRAAAVDGPARVSAPV
ncbi:MAG: nicotinamide mononucleotide transporter, partial [Cellulomonadaceae bacterium]|nr:nicotinamide mononucleotide transporter [Cellulomonadaceae bacterium]